MITKKDLENYVFLEKRIQSTKKKIEHYKSRQPIAIHGKVTGSSANFPYIERGFTVGGGGFYGTMNEEKRLEKIKQLEIELDEQLKELEEKRLDIEEFIVHIDDPSTQLIFSYVFVDGMSHDEAGERLGYERSTVTKRISKYMSTIPQ